MASNIRKIIRSSVRDLNIVEYNPLGRNIVAVLRYSYAIPTFSLILNEER
jgi:hypothetical protein